MDVPHLDIPATTTTTGDEPAPSRLLPGLWLATAVALVVAPLLTQFRVRNQSTEGGRTVSVDGWGQWDDVTISHNMRVAILFVAIAFLLVLSVVATVAWRRARWPVWLGLSASVMALTAGALQLAELEDSRSLWEPTPRRFGPT